MDRIRFVIPIMVAIILAMALFSFAENVPVNTINVMQGEEFKITLESNRTTGYQWQLAQPLDSSMVEFIASEYLNKDGRVPGQGGEEIWSFRAVDPGKTEIYFKYVRPWETDELPAKEEKFVVIINTEG